MKAWLALLGILALAGCSNAKGLPLPEISKSDPVWSLPADHLEYGALPR